MFKSVWSVLSFLILFASSLYSIWNGGNSLFYRNILDNAQFKEFVLNKKVKKVYITKDKAWFFEYFRRGRGYRTKQWEASIENNKYDDLLNFLKENNVQVFINPSYINMYWEKLGGLLWIIFGILIIIRLLIKPDFR